MPSGFAKNSKKSPKAFYTHDKKNAYIRKVNLDKSHIQIYNKEFTAF